MPEKTQSNTTVIDRIKAEIETMRPFIQEDGGDVEFKSFDAKTGTVTVELQGHCVGCPLSTITLKQGLEENIRSNVPEVTEVISL